MSQRQGGGGICTKNGGYCEKEKKVGGVGGGRCEQRGGQVGGGGSGLGEGGSGWM